MIPLFRKKVKKDNWEIRLYEDMKQAEEEYTPYAVYFQKLAKIRHDFANYVQSVQFFEMDENAALEGKKMKDGIIDLVENLMQDIYKVMERKYLATNDVNQYPSFQDYENMDIVLSRKWKSWYLKKGYFEEMYKDIPRMYTVLAVMKEKLSYSLAPDERECTDLLNGLDSFNDQTYVEHPVIAALISNVVTTCNQSDIDFKYKAQVPDSFEIPITDVYYIYDLLLEFALRQASGCDNRVGKREMRFRTASQYGLWHLHLECPPGVFLVEKSLLKLLKKYKITYKYKCINAVTEIDLIR